MSLVGGDSMSWPGFRYTAEEKALLTAVSKNVGVGELGLYYLVDAVLFIALAAVFVVLGFIPIIKKLYPVASETPASAVALLLGLICAIMVGIVLPQTAVVSAGIVSKIYKQPAAEQAVAAPGAAAVSEDAVTALFKKFQGQCLLVGLVVTAIGFAGIPILAMQQGQSALLIQTLLRLITPAISFLLLVHIFGRLAARGK
jgi:hypothetical protein